MVWVKEIGARGAKDGWRDDLPLDHELPAEVEVDCSARRLPIHPMFAVRVRVFVDWHTREGRAVAVTPRAIRPHGASSPRWGIDPGEEPCHQDDTIVPVTRLAEVDDVESVAARTQEIIEYQLTDVSPLGQATFMAV